MPRQPRLRLAGIPVHVIQRGNNRSACFLDRPDYVRYLRELKQLSGEHEVAVHAYVLMTNHVHLLVTPRAPDGISQLMKFLGQRYVQYINRKYERTGSLWEGRFRSCLVDTEAYLITCHRYIEANPVRAGLVPHQRDYPWSSYHANALGSADAIVTPHPILLSIGQTAYADLSRDSLEPRLVDEIRQTTNGGFALGRPEFHYTMADALGRRVFRAKAGRPLGSCKGSEKVQGP